MATPKEIIENAKGHLREIAGDSVEILKKSNDKVVAKLDEMQSKKEAIDENHTKAKIKHVVENQRQLKAIEDAVKNQKEVESISINNPEAITGDLKAGLEGIITTLKDELKNFDKNITVKNDFSNFASLFKSSQDKTSVIDALKKIEDKLGEESEDIDYTGILSDIANAVEDKEAVGILKQILAKELNIKFPEVMPVDLDPNLIEDDRVKVKMSKEQLSAMTAVGTSNSLPIVEAVDKVSDNQTNNEQKTQIVYKRSPEDGIVDTVDQQHPLPTDGDTVYAKDVWVAESDMGNFSGEPTDIVDNLHSIIVDETTDAIKHLLIHFNRTVPSTGLALGAVSGNFSNVKVYAGVSGFEVLVVDESLVDTKRTTYGWDLDVVGFNYMRLEFHTTDTVTLSNLFFAKAITTVSRIQGRRDDGTFATATLSNSNRLRTVAQPYTYAIAEGDIPEHDGLLKFGTRETVSAGVESTAWEGPTNRYVYMTTAQRLYVVSTSAADDGAGIGIRTLTISGLDADYNEISETVTMDGITPVLTDASFLRVFRAFGATCGTSYTNVGTISILNNAQTVTQAIINPLDGQTLMTMWTVPIGKTAYLVKGSVSTSSNKGARISLFVRKLNGGIQYPWLIKYRGFIFSGAIQIPVEIPYVLPEKTDIEMTVLTPVNAGETALGGTFELWYENN